MLRHYIKVALRLIRRSLLFSSINLMGFVLGLTAAFLIYLWVVDELTHDDCFRDGNRIYRVTELRREPSGEIKESARTLLPFARDLKRNFPEVEAVTGIIYENIVSFTAENGKVITARGASVDSTFFRFFAFPVVEGNPEHINNAPMNIVVSHELARKFFGNSSAVGQTLTFSFGRNTVNEVFTIVAVVDMPRKSHIRFDLVRPLDIYHQGSIKRFGWDNFRMPVYVKMKSDVTVSRSRLQAMSRIPSEEWGGRMCVSASNLCTTSTYTHTSLIRM